jgi:hypothetical protein
LELGPKWGSSHIGGVFFSLINEKKKTKHKNKTQKQKTQISTKKKTLFYDTKNSCLMKNVSKEGNI